MSRLILHGRKGVMVRAYTHSHDAWHLSTNAQTTPAPTKLITSPLMTPPLTAPSLPPPSVPAAVGEVTVSNNGRSDFLSVSWRPAPGEVDSYLVTLSDRDRTLHTVSVSKSSPECVFNSLVSGRLYNISISSRSGLHHNHTLIQERTRESEPRLSQSLQQLNNRVFTFHLFIEHIPKQRRAFITTNHNTNTVLFLSWLYSRTQSAGK